jgi:hypothetical protein
VAADARGLGDLGESAPGIVMVQLRAHLGEEHQVVPLPEFGGLTAHPGLGQARPLRLTATRPGHHAVWAWYSRVMAWVKRAPCGGNINFTAGADPRRPC